MLFPGATCIVVPVGGGIALRGGGVG